MPSKLPLIIGIFIAFLLAGAFVLMDRPQDSGLLPGNEAPYMPSTENNEEMPPAPPANDQQANEEGEASDGPSQQNEEQARSIVIS